MANEAIEFVEVKSFRNFIIMKLRRRYSEITMTLQHIFKEKKVNVEELITTLCFDDVEKNSVFSTDTAFNTIKTVKELFHHVA